MSQEATEWKNKGNAALSSGNHDEAIQCYTKAIEFDSKQHVFYSNRSAAYLSKDDAQNALQDAETCISLKPDWGKGYSRKGAALHHMKKYREATTAYEEGLKVEPQNAACESGLEEVKKALNGFGNPLAAMASAFGPDMFAKIATNPRLSPFLSDQEFVKKLQEIQADPNKLSAHMQDRRVLQVFMELSGFGNMAAGAEDNEDYPANESPVSSPKMPTQKQQPVPEPVHVELTPEEKELKETKECAEAAKTKGNNFYKKKQFPEAIEAYNEAIEKDPTNISYLSNRAAVKLEMGNYDDCIVDCKEAIKVGRENRADYALIAKAYVRIGSAYLKKGDEYLGDVLAAYEAAQVENRSKDVEQKIKKVQQLQKKAAERAYIDPEKAIAAKEKGNDYFKSGDFPKAVQEYSEAIKRDPTNPIYYANRAAALTKLTSFVDAKSDCDKALELDPKYVKAYSRRGAIEFFMKEYHKSLESYNKGLEIDPTNVECKEGMLRVQYKIQEESRSGNVDKERAAHAMADPEIQAILRDPVMQAVLNDFQTNPSSAQRHLQNPDIMSKIEKLIAAGVLQTR